MAKNREISYKLLIEKTSDRVAKNKEISYKILVEKHSDWTARKLTFEGEKQTGCSEVLWRGKPSKSEKQFLNTCYLRGFKKDQIIFG